MRNRHRHTCRSGRVALLPTTPEMSSTFFARGILVVFDVLNRLGHLDHLQRTTKLAFQPRHREAPSGLRVGPNSSGPKDPSFERLRPLLYSTPKAGYAVEDEASALYVHCLFAARGRDLGVLEAPPGVPVRARRDARPRQANFVSMPARLVGLLGDPAFNARVAADVESGTLDAAVAAVVGPALAAELEAALGPGDAARAGEIRAALGDGAAGFALRLWPKLKLILANATGAFEPHARRLRAGAGAGVPIRSTILAASEGLMGVSLEPRDDGAAAYCLVPRAMVFEFLPVVDGEAGDATVLAGELEAGADYELVVTTLGGLCRYRLGDVVRAVAVPVLVHVQHKIVVRAVASALLQRSFHRLHSAHIPVALVSLLVTTTRQAILISQ